MDSTVIIAVLLVLSSMDVGLLLACHDQQIPHTGQIRKKTDSNSDCFRRAAPHI